MAEPTKTPRRPRGRARLIEGKCIVCGARCQSACPSDSIAMNDVGAPVIDAAKCTSCMKCMKICPAGALEMHFTAEENVLLAEIAARRAESAAAAGPESAPGRMTMKGLPSR